MSQGYQFRELVAVESVAARRVVIQFADRLFDDQLATWDANRAAGRPNKPRPPTRQECRAKSVQIRVKRERDTTSRNDLVDQRVQPKH